MVRFRASAGGLIAAARSDTLAVEGGLPTFTILAGAEVALSSIRASKAEGEAVFAAGLPALAVGESRPPIRGVCRRDSAVCIAFTLGGPSGRLTGRRTPVLGLRRVYLNLKGCRHTPVSTF